MAQRLFFGSPFQFGRVIDAPPSVTSSACVSGWDACAPKQCFVCFACSGLLRSHLKSVVVLQRMLLLSMACQRTGLQAQLRFK